MDTNLNEVRKNIEHYLNLNKVRKNIEHYFEENLPQYTVLEIKRKSCHPDDWYLYMVSAQKTDGTYAVWTSWNESTCSLNYGHYGITSLDECHRIFSENQGMTQCFAVYKKSSNLKRLLFVTDSEKSARNFCEQNQWQLVDENEFVWDLDYEDLICVQ